MPTRRSRRHSGHLLGRLVDVGDLPLRTDGHQRVQARLDQAARVERGGALLFLGALAFGDLLQGEHQVLDLALPVEDRRQRPIPVGHSAFGLVRVHERPGKGGERTLGAHHLLENRLRVGRVHLEMIAPREFADVLAARPGIGFVDADEVEIPIEDDQAAHAVAEERLREPELLEGLAFRPFALADVAHDADRVPLAAQLDRRDRQLDRKLAAVAFQRGQFQGLVDHRAGAGQAELRQSFLECAALALRREQHVHVPGR